MKGNLFNAGVPPDRQKVMVSGATILDEDWGKAKGKIKEVLEEQQILHELVDIELYHLLQNVMLLMMGSAEELPQAPSERPKFIEDMSEAEAAAAVSRVCVMEEENVCVCVCVGGGDSCASLTAIYTHTHSHIP